MVYYTLVNNIDDIVFRQNTMVAKVLTSIESLACCEQMSLNTLIAAPVMRIIRLHLLVGSVCSLLHPGSQELAVAQDAQQQLEQVSDDKR